MERLGAPSATEQEGIDQVADEPSNGTEPAPEPPPQRLWQRRALPGVAALAVILLAGAALVAFRGDEPTPTTTTTTTTTTEAPSTTTSTVPELPAGTVEVAVAKASVPSLHVRSTPPTAWATSTLAVRTSGLPEPPVSQESAGERPALPRPDLPVVGRVAVEDGWRFENPGPYEPSQPFTMMVTERRGEWVEVLVPVRPNGTRGWVRAADVEVRATAHRVEIHLGERVLRAYDGAEMFAETPVVIGAPSTPTPTGTFYVTDIVPQTNPGGAYGPVALATDGYSEAMDSFGNGVPVIAVHGTNRPELVGRAVANGCVRVPNEVITLIADTIDQGTPVYIWP